jgi:arabinose-5-phosphate isomerase
MGKAAIIRRRRFSLFWRSARMLRTPAMKALATAESVLTQAREVLRVESDAVLQASSRLDDHFVRAVEQIVESPGWVVVTGMGKAGWIGQKIAATLASTGTRAQFLHPAEASHGDLGRVSAGDVLLALSHSGETNELLHILPFARDLGASTIAITSRQGSTLGRQADIVLAYGDVTEACPIGLAPSASCAVMLAVGDALAFALMRHQDFAAEDFGRYHPSGSLGRKLRRVEEVMRTGVQLRIAAASGSVRDVFIAAHRPGRRTGAICLVDRNGRLAGLFTDSDLARLLASATPDAIDAPIDDLMTSDPITIPRGALVQDVLDLFKRFQVSEIPVVDEERRPVGIVDITDLVDLLPEGP